MAKRIRSIPPITSTGRQRREQPARLEGLANMSLGRWISEKRGSFGGRAGEQARDSWDPSKHLYKRPERRKPLPGPVRYEPRAEYLMDIVRGYDTKGNLGVLLQFRGLRFLEGTFTQSRKSYGEDARVFYTRVEYSGREAFLILSTMGDILELEVVPQRKGIGRLFDDEVFIPTHIPKFLERYDPSSMEVVLRNGLIVIDYGRKEVSE